MRQVIRVTILAGLLLTISLISAQGPLAASDPDGHSTEDGFNLKPASAVVKAGRTITLRLLFCVNLKDRKPPRSICHDPDDHLFPLKDDAVDVKWKVVDGHGSINGDKKGATYHAPASKPTPNKAIAEATVTYNLMGKKRKEILRSNITIMDAPAYTGTFTSHYVTVNSEYTSDLAGNIEWDFEEYYDVGDWKEYKGRGTAAFSVKRIGCGEPASFSDVPVEGWLKVYKDNKYEFQINLLGDAEVTRTCYRPDLDKDLTWEETLSLAGSGMSSADPCGVKEFYPKYTDVTDLTFGRNGSCDNNVTNLFKVGWSFKAME
jgi:hypothetical protein